MRLPLTRLAIAATAASALAAFAPTASAAEDITYTATFYNGHGIRVVVSSNTPGETFKVTAVRYDTAGAKTGGAYLAPSGKSGAATFVVATQGKDLPETFLLTAVCTDFAASSCSITARDPRTHA